MVIEWFSPIEMGIFRWDFPLLQEFFEAFEDDGSMSPLLATWCLVGPTKIVQKWYEVVTYPLVMLT